MTADSHPTAPPSAGLAAQMGIDAADQAARKSFIGFGPADAAELAALAPLIQSNAHAIVERFYDNIRRYPELEAVINRAGSSVERLKQTQRQYLLELFTSELDSSYFDRRLAIGVIHHRIGLTPRWYIGSYSVYSQLITPIILRHYRFRPDRAARAVAAVQKVLALDAQLAIDTYIHELMEGYKRISLSKGEIEQRVDEYSTLVQRVTHGDLTARVEGLEQADDGLGRLGDGLNAMVDSLSGMSRRVTEASNSILDLLEEVQEAVAAQSSGASQQAISVNETTSTLEEIRSTSRQTLEKAMALGASAERTRQEGSRGLEAVEENVQAMRDIRAKVEAIGETVTALSTQTQQIGEITAVVTDLAQQLKMLALNASIEAAKAGEAGRGFAVVAAEVKELAEQSQQGTAQVQHILLEIRTAGDRAVMAMEEGTRGVDRGLVLAERTGSAVQALMDVIQETSLGGQQIVAAVRQEAAGIEQIATAMTEINKVTGQFVSATRNTASASEALSEHAAELQRMVRQFKHEGAVDFAAAKGAHHAWLLRVHAFLEGRGTLTDQEAISHHHCELGRWYDEVGRERYGDLPELRQLERPHAELHQQVQELRRAKAEEDFVAQAAAEQRIRDLSTQISALLDRLSSLVQ